MWTAGSDKQESGCFTWNTNRKTRGVYTNWLNNPSKVKYVQESPSYLEYNSIQSDKVVEAIKSQVIVIDSQKGFLWVVRPSDSEYNAICEIEMDHFDEILKKSLLSNKENDDED